MFNSEKVDLLIVDDDSDFRSTVVRRFFRRGFQVHEAASGQEALDLARRKHFDVAIVDMVMPGMTGLDLLAKLREIQCEAEVILLTGQGTIESAVEAMKLGAYDYVTKPFPLIDLETLIEKAYERGLLKRENRQLKVALQRTEPSGEMIGQSPAMQSLFRLIERAGPSDRAILIQGESGTGKELVARALHKQSARADHQLVVINCAALPEPLLESELFGHEKGAFTGAFATKLGLFEVADGGTLLIDEIGEMTGPLQAKLLRILEDGLLRRVGSVKERRVDVRILAATNRDMAEEVAEGRFREDLYYRINVMSLDLPPLREREGDVRLLVERFIGPDWSIEDEALAAIERFDWPGNIRQLQNAIERAKIMADANVIRRKDLPPETLKTPLRRPKSNETITDDLAAIEKAHVVDVLEREGGNKARAARSLGINRRSLYRLLDKYELRERPHR